MVPLFFRDPIKILGMRKVWKHSNFSRLGVVVGIVTITRYRVRPWKLHAPLVNYSSDRH